MIKVILAIKTTHRSPGIPWLKVSNAWHFRSCWDKQAVVQTAELSMIWDAMTFMHHYIYMKNCKAVCFPTIHFHHYLFSKSDMANLTSIALRCANDESYWPHSYYECFSGIHCLRYQFNWSAERGINSIFVILVYATLLFLFKPYN